MKKTQFLKRQSYRWRRFERKNYSAFKSMNKAVTIGVLSVATLSSAAQKPETINDSTVKTGYAKQVTLEDVTLVEDALPNQMGKVVQVLTAQDIEGLKAQSVGELLSTIASVDIQTRGAHGVQADVSLRGGNFDQTAILLDGINISDPHTGHYSMDIPLNLDDIERIEIIKGPSAIIFGASAFSGGVNIITKKGVDKHLMLKAEYGQNGFLNLESSIAKKIKNMENSLSFGYKHSEGYIENSAYDVFNALYRNNIYLNHGRDNLQFMAGYTFKDYDANTFYSAKYPKQHDRTSAFLLSGKGVFNCSSRWMIIPSLYYNLHTDEYELIKTSGSKNYHLTNVAGSNLTFKYYYKHFSLNFGADARYEQILSSVLGTPMQDIIAEHYNHHKQRFNLSTFVQGNYTANNFTASLGLLSFENTDIEQGFNLYPSVNLAYKMNTNWDMYASLSSSTRLPTFTELYYQDAVHQANPSLKQEQSQSIEMGIRFLDKLWQVNLAAYYFQGKNLIDWMKYSPSDDKWHCMNINSLDRYGVDLSASGNISLWDRVLRLNLSYSWMHSLKSKDDYISQYAFNYLKHKANLNLNIPIYKGLSLMMSNKYCVREGSYVNLAGEKLSYNPFFTMDASLQYERKGLSFYLSATNIFDADYFDIGNIPQPGRWIIIGCKYNL